MIIILLLPLFIIKIIISSISHYCTFGDSYYFNAITVTIVTIITDTIITIIIIIIIIIVTIIIINLIRYPLTFFTAIITL